jgi:Flp pilus assembly protein TadD
MHNYTVTLYNTYDDNLLPYMRTISEAVLKYYPKHVESLTDVSLTYMIPGEFDKALPYLLRAEAESPKDVIVLNNIAVSYMRKKDTANAKAYFEKIIQYGNADEIAQAKQKIAELK